MAPRTATLVLSGGGAKGAFQVGAERILREEHGYRWDRVFGVSVGALNATLIGQGEYRRLLDVWRSIREQDVYRKFSWFGVGLRIALLKRRGMYDNRPLRATLERHAAGRPFEIPVHVGRVSLVTGDYELVRENDPGFLDAVWHSTTMPVIWEPVGERAWVDGGVRNVTPLGDALKHEPEEIVVIECDSGRLEASEPPGNILEAAKRSLAEVAINEIMHNDVREFVRINDLVKQAETAGVALRKPDGTPLRYCPITIVKPEAQLGDTLDFSSAMIEHRIRAGETAARKAVAPG